MKVLTFVEGDAEEQMIRHFIFKNQQKLQLIKDAKKFYKDRPLKDFIFFHIHNSTGVDKLPYDIVDYFYKLDSSEDYKLLIICDVEKKFKCPGKRKKCIADILEAEIENKDEMEKLKLHYVFSDPNIEQIYLSEEEMLMDTLNKLAIEPLEDKVTKKNKEILIQLKNDHVDIMKKICRNSGLVYSKSKLAEKFFAKLNYEECSNETIKRLVKFIHSL